MVEVANINELLEGKTDKKILDYYSDVLLNSQKRAFDLGADVYGLSGEITLARSQIRSILEQEPHNFKEVRASIFTLERLIRTRFYVSKGDSEQLAVRVANILANIDLPEGISHADLCRAGEPHIDSGVSPAR